jgi:hypothetical protein
MTERLTAFLGDSAIGRGDGDEIARLIRGRPAAEQPEIRAYDDSTGRVVDIDYRDSIPPPPRGRGRPRMGVAAREVTLLPRHWEWLAAQPGGASAALRRLVDSAREAPPSPEARRDCACRFMADRCGDRPGYEEALRALYRGDRARLDSLLAAWPADVRDYILTLLG